MRERSTETPKEIFVPITINRASVGNAPDSFAIIHAIPGVANHIAYVPRLDITVNEQPITGEELSARLKVTVIAEDEQGFLVETKNEGQTVRWNVDKKGRTIPARLKPIFNV